MKMYSSNAPKIVALSIILALLSACAPESNNAAGPKAEAVTHTEIKTPSKDEMIEKQVKTAGFCNARNPNTPRSQLTGSAEDCNEATARINAAKSWVGLNCTGNADPNCSTGCVDPSKECQAYPGDLSNMTCTQKNVSASICPDQIKYECEIVQPSPTQPIACSCECL